MGKSKKSKKNGKTQQGVFRSNYHFTVLPSFLNNITLNLRPSEKEDKH